MKVKPQEGILGLCSFISDVSNFSLSKTLVFLILRVFLVWTTLKKHLFEFVTILLLLFMVFFFFGPEVSGISAP